MSLVPDGIAGKRPGCADADEEVAPGLSHHEADKNEEQSDGRQHGSTHFEIVVSKTPGEGQPVEVDHEPHDQHNRARFW